MKTSVKIVITLLVLALFAFLAVASGDRDKSSDVSEALDGSDTSSEKSEIPLGTTSKIGDFEIKATSFDVLDQVVTDNEYGGLDPEPGSKYAVVGLEVKNVGTQSQGIDSGALVVVPPGGGEPLVMDEEETPTGTGYEKLYSWTDKINPKSTKSTKLVYKISSEIKGKAYYDPEIEEDKTLFYLGEIQ